jgi:PAS domain S-box-containing protein
MRGRCYPSGPPNAIDDPSAPRSGVATNGSALTRFLRSTVVPTALLTLVYLGLARAEPWLPATNPAVCCLWPAAGIALAVLWRYGAGCWVGVLLGSLAALLANGSIPPAVALLVAAANAASALVGVSLLRRLPHFDSRLQRLEDVVGLALISAIAPVISATVSLVATRWTGSWPAPSEAGQWITAWSGAFLGALVAAPLLLVWLTGGTHRLERRQLVEAVALGTLTLAGVWAVYAGPLPRPSLLYPLVIWAALRFDLRGVTLVSATLALAAVWATAAGFGPLVHPSPMETALSLEVTVAVTMVLGLVTASVTAERRQAEATLAQQKEILQTIFDHVPVMISCVDRTGPVRWVNRCWQGRLGWSPEETAEDLMAELCPDPEDRRRATELMRSADSHWADFRIRTRSGELLDTSWATVRLSDGTTIAIGQDVSERKEAERALRTSEVQLRQSQKMEAVGRLAGGVAHDFNNLLTSILGHTELLLAEMAEDDARREDIAEIRHAAERAADLTSQLLAFSRKQVIAPKVLDLNAVIGRITGMLGRLIGEPIALATALEPTLGRVLADPGQIEQVLVNLVVNARDAMPEGGRLRIETDNVVLEEAFARRYDGALPGPHVMLAVIDEGAGMDPEVQSHIFEPFFTTKDKAKGTGLGLATVYGIVKQSGGYIAVDSAPGAGTSVRIYLPLAAVMPLPEVPARPERTTRGSETILLVEDEDSVRGLTRRILAKAGYTVLSAPDAHEALRVSAEYQSRIDLLLTDVIMSGPSGPRLAETLAGLRADLAVLFMSGYNEDTIVRQGVLRQGVAYLQKPFTPAGLLHRVRDTLDQRAAPGRAVV